MKTFSFAIMLAAFSSRLCVGDVYDWRSGELIAGTEALVVASGANLSNWSTEERNLRFGDFENASLNDATFERSWLENSRFTSSDLSGADFTFAVLNFADFTGAQLTQASFSGAWLDGSVFANATIGAADFGQATERGFTAEQLYSTASYKTGSLAGIELDHGAMQSWDLSRLNLTNADLRFANLANARLNESVLIRADLSNSDLTGTNVADTILNDSILTRSTGFTLAQLYSSASYKTGDLSGIQVRGLNFADGDFSDQNLMSVDFSETFIRDTNFRNANLSQGNFDRAIMLNANLAGANVIGTSFKSAGGVAQVITLAQLSSTQSFVTGDLSGIVLDGNKFAGADFSNINFSGSSLGGVTLDGANFRNANLSNSNLRSARLLDTDLTGAIIDHVDLSRTSSWLRAEQLYSTANYVNHDLSGINFSDNMLVGWNFEGVDLTATNFDGVGLEGAVFRNARLTNSTFAGIRMDNGDFTGADLAYVDFDNARFGASLFTDALITGTEFSRSSLTPAQLYSTANYKRRDLRGVQLVGNNLVGWDFSGQDLSSAILTGADLTNASFFGADLADADLENAILVGANLSGAAILGASLRFTARNGLSAEQLYSTESYRERDLSNIDLSGNDLSGWSFLDQTLDGTTLSGVNLNSADFSGASIRGTVLSRTVSRGFTKEQLYSTLSYVDRRLSDVDLSRNDLTRWSFIGQDLRNANFEIATLADTDFSFADLRGATVDELEMAVTRNAIRPDGIVAGLNMSAAEKLTIRDFDIPIQIANSMSLSTDSVLEFVISDASWGSTVVVSNGIEPSISSGTLSIEFDGSAADLVGVDFNLFDWGDSPIEQNKFRDIRLPVGTVWDLTHIHTTGIARFVSALIIGDFDSDGILTAVDINMLTDAIGRGATDPVFDVDGNGAVNIQDRVYWVEEVRNTYFGDANLDGEFSSRDFVAVFQAAEYEDQLDGNSLWQTGDWNGDRDFTTADFVLAFQSHSYENGPKNRNVVPEPTSPILLAICAAFGVLRWRKAVEKSTTVCRQLTRIVSAEVCHGAISNYGR